MSRDRLPDSACIGRVRLRVRDLERALSFYERVIGLHPLTRSGEEVELSPTGTPPAVLMLVGDRSAPPRPPRTTGLFHFALLVPERRDLGRVLLHVREQGWPFQGFADHSVSQSLYLADPEGNGIELYADRPRSTWVHAGGEIRMTTDPLDVASLIEEAEPREPFEALPRGTVVGHIHLEVSDLDRAEEFYVGLGFDPTLRSYPGARFLAAGGYHHHVALNVWNGAQGKPPAGALGLVDYEILVPGAANIVIAA